MKISYNHNHIVTRYYDDFAIVYNLYTRKIIILKDVSSDIWNYIYSNKQSIDINEIYNHICHLYNVSESDITNDIIEFINDLFQDNYIQIDSNDFSSSASSISDTNKSNDIEGEIIYLMQERDQIFSATFELTYMCNEKCIHCYASYPNNDKPPKTLNLIKCKELIDELYNMNCCQIIFTGGDPFMFDGFIELFKYARSRNFVCDIYTNGYAIANNPKLLNEIVPLLPKAFYISIYGSTSYVHDAITQIPGSFCKTITTIKMLSQANISVVLNVMIMKPNYHQIQDIINLADELHTEYRIGLSIINKNNGDTTPTNYFIDNKQILKEILSIINKNFFSMDVPISNKKKIKNGSICGAGTSALCISPDGEVYPCVSLKISLGSVFTNTLYKIWNSEKRKSMISSLILSNTSECTSCEYFFECPHCVGISQAECGNQFACNTCDHLIAECIHELKKI